MNAVEELLERARRYREMAAGLEDAMAGEALLTLAADYERLAQVFARQAEEHRG